MKLRHFPQKFSTTGQVMYDQFPRKPGKCIDRFHIENTLENYIPQRFHNGAPIDCAVTGKQMYIRLDWADFTEVILQVECTQSITQLTNLCRDIQTTDIRVACIKAYFYKWVIQLVDQPANILYG